MRKKILVAAVTVLLFSLVTGGIAFAFSATNVDGVWGKVDGEACTPTSLYFSKYVYNNEYGHMDALALGIFNGTGAAIDLSAYSVRLYYETGIEYNTLNLTGTLVDDDVWVLVNSGYVGSVTGEDQTFTNNEYYRTIVLYQGTTIVDMIGDASATPTANPAGKNDRTFTRNWVCSGDPYGDTTYREWAINNYAYFSNLDSPPTPPAAGATCDNYATGGDDTLNTLPTSQKVSWWIQGPPYTDFNQVRYGSESDGDCLPFIEQSGMGFDGANSVPSGTDFKAPFLLGTFCHYNNPINSSNSFEYVNLDVTITGLYCEAPLIPGNATPSELTFTYQFLLDETTNNLYPCPYLPGDPVNNNGCADAIFISQDPSPEYFTCYSPGDPPIEVEYTVAVQGFMQRDENGECPAWDARKALGRFISGETTSNCSCVYGMITDFVPTAVDLLSFKGMRTAEGVLLEWKTANEIENLGFNLYRATSENGAKLKLNTDLIPTSMMPGSLIGASYSYEDLTALTTEGYYYWLEDVDANGITEMHGPVEVPLD